MPEQSGSVLDVLSGKQSLKFNVSMDYVTIGMLVGGIFIAVLAGVVIARKIS